MRRITLQNIRISAKGGGSAELARREVPEIEKEYPDADMFGDLPAYGLFCRHAEVLVLDTVHFHLENPDSRPALILDQVEDIELRGSSAAPPAGEEPAIALHNVRRCFMQGLGAKPGTKNFCKLSGPQTAKILALGNDFSEATTAFQLASDVDKIVLQQQANFASSETPR